MTGTMRTLRIPVHRGASSVPRRSRLAVVVAATLMAVTAIATAGTATADVEPGTVVVATQEGTVVALLANGKTTELATGLGQVQSLAVLSDGTMLTTDYAGNRLMGFGGRLGETPVQVAAVDHPSGVTVGTDGTVYLTGLDGVLYRVDVDTGVVVPFADGLVLPGTPAEQGGLVYVPQGLLGAATVATADGAVAPLSVPVGQPGVVAAAKSTPVLFSDTQGNKIFKYDPSTRESDTFVEVTAPGPIAIDPTPRKGQAWSLLIGTPNAVVRVDAKGAVQERIEVDGTITGVGQATVAIATGSDSSTSKTTDVVTEVEVEDSGGGGFPITILLVLLLAAAVVAGVVFLVKRSTKREAGADWFNDPPAPPDPPPSASSASSALSASGPSVPSGPSASSASSGPAQQGGFDDPARSQVSPDEAQLVEVRNELAGLTASAANTARQASTLGEMVARAIEARTTARINREKAALLDPSAAGATLTADMLELRTDEGRAHFDAQQAGQIDLATLRERWTALGESDALEQVFRYRDDVNRADLAAPSPEERHAAREAFDARQELIAVEAEQARVGAEINRLRGLEAELNRRVHGMPAPPTPPGSQGPAGSPGVQQF